MPSPSAPMSNAVARRFDDSFVRDPFGPAVGSWGMPIDVFETDEEFVLEAALPGANPDAIDVSVVGNQVTLRAETAPVGEVEDAQYVLRERRYGRYTRSLTLPVEVQADAASADYEAGLLRLTLPKVETEKPKSVKVRSI